ncbi:AEC family transporter [Patulibacter sp.]|uniref:AEC family transporter n=1 Tax=Patulibacter sp. TaxID=1912859 RepID=UPI002719CB8D|nr:AEC family transporter [Patulibacter sp.]MDO9410177.1 AEC family transporter [Patulibacter sp.]
MSLPVLVAVMVAATLVGIGAERRFGTAAEERSRTTMGVLLTWVLPPVYLVLVSRLHVDLTLVSGLITGFVALGTVGVLAWFVSSRLLHLPAATVGAVILATIVSNTGYFGLPLVRTVLGGDELGPAVAWDSLVAQPTVFVSAFAVGAAFGTVGGGEATGRGSRLVAFLRNPLLWASVLGLVVPGDAPDWAGDVAQVIIVAVLPVGFFVVGVQLSAQGEDGSLLRDARGRLLPPEVALVVVLRLVVAPLIVLTASVVALDLPPGMLLQAAVPTGLNGMLVAHRFGLDFRPVAASIVWTTSIMALGVLVVEAVG